MKKTAPLGESVRETENDFEIVAPTRAGRPFEGRGRWLGFLIPPLMLGAVGLGFWIVLQGPRGILWAAIGVGVSVPILWVVTSALWPAKADRRCPRCRGEKLERMDPKTTVGVRCSDCGYRDEAASGWLLAEEEGPLETIVLAERKARAGGNRERIAMGRRSPVDSGAPEN